MNSFYSEKELSEIGLNHFGENVLISRKASIYSPENISIGNNVRIDDFCILSGNIELGNYIHIAAYTALYGRFGIKIKNFSGLSPRCTIFSAIDDFGGDFLISPMPKDDHTNVIGGAVLLSQYVQIGADTIIFPNITIAEGTVIGAKSLVKESTDEWSIYTGVPAKRIKERKKGLLNFVDFYNK